MSNTNQRQVHHQEVAKKTGNSPTVSEHEWTIPDGETLKLVRFSGGSEYSAKETRVELVHRTGGDETVAVGYGSTFEFFIDMDFVGNGSDKVVIRLVNGDASELNMAGWWQGVTHG